MRLNDLRDRILKAFTRTAGDTTRRPDGGTSCYRPIRRKSEVREQEAQPLTYIHTGFTGMNPPASGYDSGYGTELAGSQFYAQQGYHQEPVFGQPGMASQQPAGQMAPMDPSGYDQPVYGFGGEDMQGRNAGRIRAEAPQTAADRPARGWFPPRGEAAVQSNISYMPGYSPDSGAAPFNHVEHIMILTGLKGCYEAIECMKNGETLIIALDSIANENESMRCQDMLAGAAFTLGCSVRMLQGARLVLIAPEGVKILPEEESVRMDAVPPVYAAPSMQPAAGGFRQRERRSGRNAAEWTAARNGQMEGYNPYTGTMPVAAGSYAGFGGYGT